MEKMMENMMDNFSGEYQQIIKEGRQRKMRKSIIRKTIIGAIAGVIMIAGASGAFAAEKHDGLTWKTTKAKNGKYITKFYASGEFTGKVVSKKKLPVKVMKSEKITYKKLVQRKNKYIIVEKTEGTCLNHRGDGRDSMGYYISYKRIKNIQPGNKYRSYLIFANNRYEDDIIGRCDYCIKRVKIKCPNCDGNSENCPYWIIDNINGGVERHMTTDEIIEFEQMEMDR